MSLNNILFATDFSESSEQAQAVAVSIAAAFGARLHFFHAFEAREIPHAISRALAPASFKSDLEAARTASAERLEAALARAKGEVDCGAAFLGDVPAPAAIAARAEAVDADLIVVGSQGHTGIQHLLLGSVAEATVRHAPCSVLTARGSFGAGGPVVVGTDFSAAASQALGEACVIADRLGADLHIVHAATPVTPMVGPYGGVLWVDYYDQILEAAEAALAEEAESCQIVGQVTTEVLSTNPQIALNQVAARIQARLIVVGSRGLTGVKHLLLGSVAERTLRHADRCVWTVRNT